jgi:hypothetical protein
VPYSSLAHGQIADYAPYVGEEFPTSEERRIPNLYASTGAAPYSRWHIYRRLGCAERAVGAERAAIQRLALSRRRHGCGGTGSGAIAESSGAGRSARVVDEAEGMLHGVLNSDHEPYTIWSTELWSVTLVRTVCRLRRQERNRAVATMMHTERALGRVHEVVPCLPVSDH